MSELTIISDLRYKYNNFWLEEYKFHFSYITVFFIMFSCHFIKNEFKNKKFLYLKLMALIIFNIIYVNKVYSIYYLFHEFLRYFSWQDLLISILLISFSQVVLFINNFNIRKKNINSINKEYFTNLESFQLLNWPVVHAVVFYIYFIQYISFSIISGSVVFVVAILVMLYRFIKLIYAYSLIYKANRYCDYLTKTKKEIALCVVNTNDLKNNEIWRYFIKPCVNSMGYYQGSVPLYNNLLGCYTLTKLQYETLKLSRENVLIFGLDCYDEFYDQDQDTLIDPSYDFSIAIKEKGLESYEVYFCSEIEDDYFKTLKVNSFKSINTIYDSVVFFDSIKDNLSFISGLKKKSGEIIIPDTITSISCFDQYLKTMEQKIVNNLDRYTVFNNILKGYEAIIHYISLYYFIVQDINIEDLLENGFQKYIENGAWLTLSQTVLKITHQYEECWLTAPVSERIKRISSKLIYPNSRNNLVRTHYDLFTTKLINMRNNTIGHGSIEYVPNDEQLLFLFEIYLYLTNELADNFFLNDKSDNVWLMQNGETFYLLHIVELYQYKYRYVNYADECFIYKNMKEG